MNNQNHQADRDAFDQMNTVYVHAIRYLYKTVQALEDRTPYIRHAEKAVFLFKVIDLAQEVLDPNDATQTQFDTTSALYVQELAARQKLSETLKAIKDTHKVSSGRY